MPYTVVLRPPAQRAIKKLPNEIQSRIIKKIESLESNPRPPGCEKIAGAENLWRVRTGDYRILYEIVEDRLTIFIVHTAHRKDVYRRF